MKTFIDAAARPAATFALFAGLIAVALPEPVALAQTSIKMGDIPGSAGFFIPSYVAMDKGFFKAEGLDVTQVKMGGKALVTAGLGGAIDFLPIPGGGSLAVLKGAKLRFVVGQGLISQWAVVVNPKKITKVEDIKGKTLSYGRPGGAAYDEGELVLRRHFNLKTGSDYNVIAMPAEPDRVAALINGNVDGALLTFPHAAKAQKAGYRILLKTGRYLPRVGGTFWVTEEYFRANTATVKKFIRAVARAEQYFRFNKAGSVEVIQKRFGIKDPQEASFIWEELHTEFGPDIPEFLFGKLFEGRIKGLQAQGLWPKDRPVPDLEQFVARDLLSTTLRELGYYLQAPPTVQGRMK